MTIYETFQVMLRQKYQREKYTNRELAAIAGVSAPHINRLMNKGPELWEKLSLKTLVKLFPEIFDGILRQDGGASNGNSPGAAAASGNGVAISGNVTLGTGAVDWAGVMMAIRKDKKMCAECKLRAMDIIDESNNGGRG